MNALVLFFLLLLMIGCTPRYDEITWSGSPGATMERDMSDCQVNGETAATVQSMNSMVSAHRLLTEQVYRECMMSKGYVQTEGPGHAVITPHE